MVCFLQASPGADQWAVDIPHQPVTTTDLVSGQAARLDVTRLNRVSHSLYEAGLAQSTQETYSYGRKKEMCRIL